MDFINDTVTTHYLHNRTHFKLGFEDCKILTMYLFLHYYYYRGKQLLLRIACGIGQVLNDVRKIVRGYTLVNK